jgi:hypothetical protein
MDKYSVAICPPPAIVSAIAAMKSELAARIGWFPSRNSHAHITINVFDADADEIGRIKSFLASFCAATGRFEVCCAETGSYPGGAFYLKPNDDSMRSVVRLMDKFHKAFPNDITDKKSHDPHMSVARQIKDKLQIAAEMFGSREIDIRFWCDRLSLRQFDTVKRQYFIDSEFLFGGSSGA